MKRYKFSRSVSQILTTVMIPSSQGEWLKWEEAQSEITRLRNKIKGLENTIDYLKQQLDKKRNLSGDH